jgi:hypothetical protein
MKRNLIIIIGSLVLIAGGIFAYLLANQFQLPAVFTSAKISLDPVSQTVAKDSVFVVNIKVTPGGAVSQAYGWRVKLSYPAELLELISASGSAPESTISMPSAEAIEAAKTRVVNGKVTIIAGDAYMSPLLSETKVQQLVFRAKTQGVAYITLSEGVVKAKADAIAKLTNASVTIQ